MLKREDSMAAKKVHGWIYPVLYFTAALILVGIMFTTQGFTDKASGDPAAERMPVMNKSFALPDQLSFAGEPVPIRNFDTRESLDREMLVNGYFHSRTMMVLKKSKRYFRVIEPVLKRYGVPDDFKYLAMAESGFENAVSPAKAVGVWQLLESTAREYGLEVNADVDERYNLEKSTEVACKFLLDSYASYGSWTMAAATYNAGRKGLDNQIEKQRTSNYYDLLLNEETARYIFRIVAHKLITEAPDQYGFHLEEGDYYPDIPTHNIKVDTAISDVAVFAAGLGTNYKILKHFNPWMRQNYLPDRPQKVYTLVIPDEGERSLKQP